MDEKFMLRAIELARSGMEMNAGGPFGCVIVKNGTVIGEGWNSVTSTNDPTSHAEIVAIRNACKELNSFQLTDCEIYTSCEPCPMCLGAIYWARPKTVYFASNHKDAAEAGFDDQFIYQQIDLRPEHRSIPFVQLASDQAKLLFEVWKQKVDKTDY
jgi:guanine deaminase